MDKWEMLNTHKRNPKTGRVEKIVPYRLKVRKGQPNVYEVAGKFYNEDGSPAEPVDRKKELEAKMEALKAEIEVEQAKIEVAKPKASQELKTNQKTRPLVAPSKEKADVKLSAALNTSSVQRNR